MPFPGVQTRLADSRRRADGRADGPRAVVRPLAGGEAALAFIAVDPATGRAVGEARLVGDERDPAAAEVAFAVADAWRNRRLGTRLACLVSRRARELGINRLRANMLAANSRSRALV